MGQNILIKSVIEWYLGVGLITAYLFLVVVTSKKREGGNF